MPTPGRLDVYEKRLRKLGVEDIGAEYETAKVVGEESL